jgi:prepilin signal peptidase PulO-like enzyme (type II secretory pathway)
MPEWFDYILLICGSLILGSFLNMALTRFHTGLSWGGRSRCMTCRATLQWQDLLPVLSFLCLRGRCRHCGVRYGWEHIFVEFLTVAAAVLLWGVYGWSAAFFILVIFSSLLIFLSVYDIKHFIIPDRIISSLFVLALVAVGFGFLPVSVQHILDIAIWDHVIAALGLPLPFFLLWLISRGRWMGMGDIKLMFVIGFLFGIVASLEALMMSFWIGGAFGLGILVLRLLAHTGCIQSPEMRRIIYQPQIPFGPFLALGSFVSLLGVQFLGIIF